MSDINSLNGVANILTSSIRQDVLGETSAKGNSSEEMKDTIGRSLYQKSNEDEQKQQSITNTLQDNLEKINEFIPITSTNLSFEFSDEGGSAFVRVVDKDSDEIIREIPSEEFREVAKALDELADKLVNKGVLFDKMV
jgi:uncharacterized FlaG/YvyC family protein